LHSLYTRSDIMCNVLPRAEYLWSSGWSVSQAFDFTIIS
jgi:hypothetical protein